MTFTHLKDHHLGEAFEDEVGSYKGYDENVNPTLANEFAAAAMRFGHGLVHPNLMMRQKIDSDTGMLILIGHWKI